MMIFGSRLWIGFRRRPAAELKSCLGTCRPDLQAVPTSEDHKLSVAFTKENDLEAAAANLPDRPISHHPNLVTPEGLAQLDHWLSEARSAYAAAQATDGVHGDRTALARATRELRYYSARRASAQLVEPRPGSTTLTFGGRVTFERADGRRQSFRIVGEDEADPSHGSVSYVSPVAQALLGKGVGETAMIAGQEVEIVEIS
jgi:transcription elongation GreA/GreB family factor